VLNAALDESRVFPIGNIIFRREKVKPLQHLAATPAGQLKPYFDNLLSKKRRLSSQSLIQVD
jgi:hypothetical protein